MTTTPLRAIRGILCCLALLGAAAQASVPTVYTPGHGHPGGGLPAGPIHGRNAITASGNPCEGVTIPYGLLSNPNCVNQQNASYLNGLLYTQAVFFGDTWQSSPANQKKVQGLNTFLSGWAFSGYADALVEYVVGDLINLPQALGLSAPSGPQPRTARTSTAPLGVPSLQGLQLPINLMLYHGYHYAVVPDAQVAENTPQQAVNDVCDGLATGRYPSAPNGTYPYFIYYTNTPRPAQDPDGRGPACGVQMYVSCPSNTVRTQVAMSVVYNADNDAQCDVQDMFTGHSKGLASEANTTARMIADTVTDTGWVGWMDIGGEEISDKCAWQFSRPFVFLANGSRWKLQDLWSNTAFNLGLGKPNFEGKKGCILPLP